MDKPSEQGARRAQVRALNGVQIDRSGRGDVRMIVWRAPGLALLTMARVHDGETTERHPLDTGVAG
jgi:hypothetical protein